MTNVRKIRYSSIPLNDDNDAVNNETASSKTKLASFIRINSLSFKTGKNVRKKQMRNPYGNVYKRRRMSISCPSTPIGGDFKLTSQFLAEVNEKLLEESEDTDHMGSFAGNTVNVEYVYI